MYTLTVEANSYVYFRFTTSDFIANAQLDITVKTTDGSTPPEMAYMVCDKTARDSCSLNTEQGRGGTGMTKSTTTTGNIRTLTISHIPSMCIDSSNCHYLISVYFPTTTSSAAPAVAF
jgi:hypothetical protein